MRKAKKWISLALSSVLLLAIMAGCGGGQSATTSSAESTAAKTSMDRNDTLIYGEEFEDTQFNPVLGTLYCGSMLYRGLMKEDKNDKPQCDIATNVSVSDDLLKYTISIRKDVKFHDGTKLTADDVVYTLDSVRDEKINSSLREDFQLIDKAEKVDDSTIRITLSKPFPALLDKLTIGIIPKHCFEGQEFNKASFNMNPVGCGPYKFVSYESGSTLVLTRFDDYYGDKAKIKNIVINYVPDYSVRALQLSTGEIDLAFVEPSQVEELEKADNTTVYKITTADYRCVMFNFKATDLFSDGKVRQALCYATDRDAIVNSIVHGYGAAAYTPLQVNTYKNSDVEKYSYDTSKAASLLKEAGWTDSDGDGILDKNGEKFSFTLTAPVDDEVRVNMATYLSSEWKKLGIDCKVDTLDWSAIDISKCAAFVLGWGSPFDADNDTYRLFRTGEPSNYGSYSNATVDSSLEQARTTSDSTKRGECYAAFQKALADDPAYDFICYLTALYGASKRISGISTDTILGHHGAGIFWNIEDWELSPATSK